MVHNSARVAKGFVAFLLLGLSVNLSDVQGQSTESDDVPDGPDFSWHAYEIFGYLQQQVVADETDDSPTRYQIPRARIGVRGPITDLISINIFGGYIEPPNDTPQLVDAFVDFDIHPFLQLRSGQFILPFGLEGPSPIIHIPTIERSTATRRLNPFRMFRDMGLQASGNMDGFSYAVALVNGEGANQREQIEPKDVMGRAGMALTDDLGVGVSGHVGYYQPPGSGNEESRYRFGIDINYDNGPLLLRGEYMIHRDDLPSGNNIHMNGGYVVGGYQLLETLEGIARIGYFDPATSVEDNYMTILTAGVNYTFLNANRLSFNYEFRDDRLNPDLGNLLTIQMQVVL